MADLIMLKFADAHSAQHALGAVPALEEMRDTWVTDGVTA